LFSDPASIRIQISGENYLKYGSKTTGFWFLAAKYVLITSHELFNKFRIKKQRQIYRGRCEWDGVQIYVIYRWQLSVKVLPNISKQFSRRFYTDFTTLRTRLHRPATDDWIMAPHRSRVAPQPQLAHFEIKFADWRGDVNLWALHLVPFSLISGGYLVAT